MTKEQLETRQQIFKELNAIDLGERIRKKLGLSYLSWANAWEILRTKYPDAEYKIYTREVETTETREITDVNTGVRNIVTNTFKTEYPYFTDGKTCWVKVGVTICGIEEVEILAVMDNHQNSVPFATITSVAVNKAIQRAFVKACARHGLGLYVYQGEDLPTDTKENLIKLQEEQMKKIKDAMNRADQLVTKELDAENFRVMQEKVINSYKEILGRQDQAAIAELVNQYITELFPGKRLSSLVIAEDGKNLQKLDTFLAEVLKMIK